MFSHKIYESSIKNIPHHKEETLPPDLEPDRMTGKVIPPQQKKIIVLLIIWSACKRTREGNTISNPLNYNTIRHKITCLR